ncbi:MAG: MmgE/PrpD family protein, partial [Alphaproteobacteria bacterium]
MSETLSRWLEGLAPEQIPDAVKRASVDTVIDVMGLCVAARNADYIRALTASWEADGGCTAMGHAAGFDAPGAAMINGTAAHGE